MLDERINTTTAADILGIHEHTLRVRRMSNYKGEPGPQWYRSGGRVHYYRSEVEEFARGVAGALGPRRTLGPRVPAPPPLTPPQPGEELRAGGQS